MASYLDDLLKKFNNSGSDADTSVYAPPRVAQPTMSPGSGEANSNFLDFLNASKETNPAAMYGAASAASAPFQSPTDTGGGQVPMRLPELKSNEPVLNGMGDSLMQRSGDDIPRPQDNLDDMQEENVVRHDIDEVPELMRKESVVDQAKQVDDPAFDPLLDAQQRSNNIAGLMMMLKGSERAGAGFARTKSDPNFVDEMKGLVNRPVEDVLTQRKVASDTVDLDIKKFNYAFSKDKDDPASPSSNFYRDTMKEFSQQSGINLKIPDNLSAAEMEKIYPNIINIVNAKEARDAKLIAMKAAGEVKLNDKMAKRAQLMTEATDPAKARAGVLSKVESMINSADRIDRLFTQFPNYNIPAAQTEELAAATAGLISGGNPQSQAQINGLIPHSMVGNANKIASWVTNDPKGMQQMKFMKLMHETALRERQVAETQRDGYYAQRIASFQDLRKADQPTWETKVRAAGMDPEQFDEQGLYIPMKNEKGILKRATLLNNRDADAPHVPGETKASGLSKEQEAGVSSFMKANKITNKDEAIQILKKAGKL